MVFVFTQPNCPACHLTKVKLTKLDIPFVESAIDDDVRAEALELGIMAAPIVTANGETWGGFRPDRIAALAS